MVNGVYMYSTFLFLEGQKRQHHSQQKHNHKSLEHDKKFET